jgi:phosphoribosylanthranilate isomerase
MTGKIKLKICGMRDAENIMQVAALSPDYMGFIFYPKSPRFVGNDFKIPAQFPTNIIRVGVFVNESTENILKHAEGHNLRFLQLHGEESVKQCQELKGHNYQIIKVFSIDEVFDFEITKYYSESVDFFLFDTKGKYYGGNAKTFRWRQLDQYNQQVPFFLSGGLSPENVSDVADLKGMNIHALDVNSGVESAPAMKDLARVQELKENLKQILTL